MTKNKAEAPEIVFSSKTSDGMPIQFWSDGRITLGRNQAYAGLARKERKLFAKLQEAAAFSATFSSDEIQRLCR